MNAATPSRSARLRPLLALALGATLFVAHGRPSLVPENLRCEYRQNPVGLDVTTPRLSWTLASDVRGQRQTAYRVVVASSAELLARDRGDLWDTGRVASDQTIHVEYQGQPLTSRTRCYWKVRVWDRAGRPSAWSQPATWTMGLLDPRDWQARWIADPQSVTNVARGPLNGYHSQFAVSPDTAKWVALDLGQATEIDAVRVYPARPYDWSPDTPGFLFPLRFRIEVAQQPDFSDARAVVDRTEVDQPNPGTNAPLFRCAPAPARYVRLTATRLPRRDSTNHAFALAELQVWHGERNLAAGVPVTASDSIETGPWAKANLVDDVLASVGPAAGGAQPAMMTRKVFDVAHPVRRATAYVTGLGLYELRLNGQRVGRNLLAPEWTDYRKRIHYQVHDVTSLLRRGQNALAAMLGEGWYAGRLMAVGRHCYGAYPRFLLQLELEFADGARAIVCSDDSWRTTLEGPIRSAGIYDGEVYDARQEMPGWDGPGFDDSRWRPARVFELGNVPLVWQPNEPIQVVQERVPVALTEPKPGVFIFDLGQNMVGWCRLEVRGAAGKTVTLRHGEMVNDDGTLYTANLRGAPQIDRYTARSDHGVFEPRFTYHGFRYAEVTGLPRRPSATALRGHVFHSASPDAGQFACSSPMLNQLMHNIMWTQRANLMSSPNDCPQRDERFGWMGDIQAFSQTAIFQMDLAAFFTKWVRDIRDDQARDGRYPDFAPHPGDPNVNFSGVPAWGDAGTIVPWRVYQNYADVRLLREHFDSARRWVDYIHNLNPDLLWRQGRNNNYNDWLNGDTLIQAGWPRQGGAVPPDLFATAFFAHSTEIVAKMAAVLGYAREAEHYGGLFARIKAAFTGRFVKEDGRLEGDTQAGYALALHFELLPEKLRPAALNHLLAGFERYGGHLSTGIQTSHRLMLELTRQGRHEEACRLITLRDFPSWGMMVENGATTIWERWDGYVKGRGFQDPGMNSFNHWAFGAVGEWVWRHLAGLNPDEAQPGYRHFVIAPQPGAQVTWVRAAYPSIRGLISSDWRLEGDRLTLKVKVPPNTTATVILPTPDAAAVLESGRPARQAKGVEFLGADGRQARFRLVAGTFTFRAPYRP